MMRFTPIVIAALGVALVAGCSSKVDRQPGAAAPAGSPSATNPATSPTRSPSAPPGTGPANNGSATPAKSGSATPAGRCHTNQLRGEVDLIFPAGHAGSEQDAMLGLTNNGPACSMYGYVRLQLLYRDGKPGPTKVVRTDSAGHVTLQHGQIAWALLAWTYLPDPDEENSEPLCGGKPSQVQIIPPDETTHLTVDAELGTLCHHGTIYVGPMSLQRPQP